MSTASRIIEEDSRYLMQSFSRWYPLVIERAKGSLVYDVDGKEYIDMNAGIGVMALGHGNEKIVHAVQEQMNKFFHYSLTDFYYDLAVRVARKLVSLVGFQGKVFYTNSGTESVEASLKIARGHTRRQYVIGFTNSFHGRTFGSMSFTSSKAVQRSSFSPLLPSTLLVPYPDRHNPLCREDCASAILDYIEDWVLKKIVDPNDVAGFLLEPIQGEGGVVVPPREFLQGLQRIARKHGILLILDEVQTGIGRTGKMFAFEHFGVEPDLVCLAKALGGGLPLGAVVGKSEIMDLPRGSHANTFGGNALALAAAEVVLEEVPRLLERVNAQGKIITDILSSSRSRYVEEIRGMGLMIGVDLRKDGEPYEEGLENVLRRSFERGVLAIGAGESVVRLLPPLVIEEELAKRGSSIIREELDRL
ncbi:[LysW]-aminoadipate semialdehyde/glutamate semialdehyde transaminase [Metallosphaera sp. J1]|uniref:acetyl ornithine aminotransferase family protein n=1 Tax=Metallosphaera javensis (ex Hofmann et al. 2022) TaxID=99938 RepID=UPI001EE132AB|nr:acetyl ornithine aminotransferase family protein [Metallosphaera javensis (ex Hofmann et al. 2022)]MCG3108936.1 [LysW]-aminoadipate semialdehyde/glutamate semialdehyde transaminase [Metallosphaera javensis (ex Hofmann et al. 2022)]